MVEGISEIARELDGRLPEAPRSEDLATHQTMFLEAARSGLHLQAMHGLLRRNLEKTFEVTPDVSSGPFLVLYGSRKTTWALLRHSGRNRQIYLSPTHTLLTKVAGGTLRLSRFTVNRPIEASMFDGDVTLIEQAVTEPIVGEPVLKDGMCEAADLEGPDARPAFTLRINTLPFADYEWAFDRNALRATSFSVVRQAESNLTTIFDLLAAVRSQRSIEHVEPFIAHHLHFVRWKAAQTLAAIDRDSGITAVRMLAVDTHPEVRTAARRTLEAVD